MVILFFTNQSSTRAVHDIPKVLSQLREDMNFYNEKEMPVNFSVFK